MPYNDATKPLEILLSGRESDDDQGHVERALCVLLLEDNPGDALLMKEYLSEARGARFQLTHAIQLSELKERLTQARFDVILLDLSLPDSQGLDTLTRVQQYAPETPIVVLTGDENEVQGMHAMQAGAQDYLTKREVTPLLLARALQYATERERRKRLETQFLQAQKMEGIGRLAGGVAHDFNNILMAILGYAEMADDALSPQSEEHEFLENIEKAAQRAASLTQQLLTFARKQIMAPMVMDLNTFISQRQESLRRLLNTKIDFFTHLSPTAGAVYVDTAQLDQVLMNLAVNARDAMPQGGTLRLDSFSVEQRDEARLQAFGAAPGEYAAFSITDTGIGMSEETKSRIFEPFFTTREQGKGIGLGLATCYGSIRQNGGYIGVDSASGQGTTFTIYLPSVHETAATSEPEQSPVPDAETVLIVESEALVRTLFAHTLKAQGYTVLEASNGLEALAVAGNHPKPLHLLVTDVIMPPMGGKELAEILCHSRPSMKVLFTSGHDEEVVRLNDSCHTAVTFLPIPFVRSNMVQQVREILAR